MENISEVTNRDFLKIIRKYFEPFSSKDQNRFNFYNTDF